MQDINIESFDWRGANEADYAALNRFNNAMLAEKLPEDPPQVLEEALRGWRSTPAFLDIEAWVVWDSGRSSILAMGRTTFRQAHENQHIVECEMGVLPGWRRQGIGRRLLARLVQTAQRDGRRLMFGWTTDRVPDGEAFANRIGAQRGLVEKVSQLDLRTLDRTLVRDWMRQPPERAAKFEIGFWDGPFPEADIQDIAALYHVMNDAPRQGLAMEDKLVTPEQKREWERAMMATGVERWAVYGRETASGTHAGVSEVFWSPYRPVILFQGATGVRPQFRKQGLGRWLKAAMLERVVRERPQVRFVRTDNADTNAAMLKINYQLGFEPLLVNSAWQVETERVLAYLAGRAAIDPGVAPSPAG